MQRNGFPRDEQEMHTMIGAEIKIAENYLRNTQHDGFSGKLLKLFDEEHACAVMEFHRQVSGYRPTPLVPLPMLAKRLGIKALYIKDESGRFGLKAFKGLGGVYAMFHMICETLSLDPESVTIEDLSRSPYQEQIAEMNFVTATDGNHGKGVSWAAKFFGAAAHVYMPKGTVPARAQAIREAGNADVEVTELSYDDCVRLAKERSERNGWLLIQDTSWDGYEKVPLWIMQGYLTMAKEAAGQLEQAGCEKPTHVFLQAGVGAMAGSAAAYLYGHCADQEMVICCMEPHEAACIYETVQAGDGRVHTASGSGETVMAGLNCGTPCTLAWEILKEVMSFAISCDDEITLRGMRLLGRPIYPDQRIVSGESGAVGTGLLDALMTEDANQRIREKLRLNADSEVLLFNTEGDTDPDHYRRTLEET